MISKLVTMSTLFLTIALVSFGGTAHADPINTSGTICQSINGIDTPDINYTPFGVLNVAAQSRTIVCAVPRSPVPLGNSNTFAIDGWNDPAALPTTCTLVAYNPIGQVLAGFTFNTAALPPNWRQFVVFGPNAVGPAAYVSMLCAIPAAGAGIIRGVTAP